MRPRSRPNSSPGFGKGAGSPASTRRCMDTDSHAEHDGSREINVIAPSNRGNSRIGIAHRRTSLSMASDAGISTAK